MSSVLSISVGGLIFYVDQEAFQEIEYFLHTMRQKKRPRKVKNIENELSEILLHYMSENNYIKSYQAKEALAKVEITYLSKEFYDQDTNKRQASFLEKTRRNKTIYIDKNEEKCFEDSEEYEESEYKQNKQNFLKNWIFSNASIHERKLSRDKSYKIIAGVLAGLGSYMSIDPALIRLVILLSSTLSVFGYYSFVLPIVVLLYIILWIVLPEIDGPRKERLYSTTYYRNKEKKYLGGVAAGLNTYFQINIRLVRIIFLGLVLFKGMGLILYTLIWICTSPNEKEQVPLFRILTYIVYNVKLYLKKISGNDKNIQTRIQTRIQNKIHPFISSFNIKQRNSKPFRFASISLKLLAYIVLFSSVIYTCLIVALFIEVSIVSVDIFGEQLFNRNFSVYSDGSFFPISWIFCLFLSIWLPFLFTGYISSSVLSSKIKVKKSSNIGLLIVWLLSLVGMIFILPPSIKNLHTSGSCKTTLHYSLSDDILIIDVDSIRKNRAKIFDISLSLNPHEEKDLQLNILASSRGETRQAAIDNARNVCYKIQMEEKNKLILLNGFTLTEDQFYTGQNLLLDLKIPYLHKFILTKRAYKILSKQASLKYSLNRELKAVWFFDKMGYLQRIK